VSSRVSRLIDVLVTVKRLQQLGYTLSMGVLGLVNMNVEISADDYGAFNLPFNFTSVP